MIVMILAVIIINLLTDHYIHIYIHRSYIYLSVPIIFSSSYIMYMYIALSTIPKPDKVYV